MTTTRLRLSLLAGTAVLPLFGMLAAPNTAHAADVTAEQGKAAEAALRDWLGGLVGSSFKVPDRPVVLTPAGDHFDAVVPVGNNGQPSASPVTSVLASVRPLDGGKWAVERLRLQTPFTFKVQTPVPQDDTPDGKKVPPKMVPVTHTIDLKDQEGGGTIDPSLSAPVTWTTSNAGMTATSTGGPVPNTTTAGPAKSVTVVTPAGDAAFDITSTTTLKDYRMATTPGAASPVEVSMKQVGVSLAATSVNRTQARTLAQNAFKVLAAMPAINAAAAGDAAAPPVPPDIAASMIGALPGIAGTMQLDETGEGVSIAVGGIPVRMDKLVLSVGGKSVDGILNAGMTLSALGLAVEGALPPNMAVLVPTEITIKPVLSGVGVAESARLLTASSQKKSPDPADVQALFSHGGVRVGVDSMTVAVAGATFGGNGAVVFTSPKDFTGTAHITATGFDNLMQAVSAIPAFAGQAMPAFALVKGMGRNVGDQIVWDIVYRDGAATVNGMALPGTGPSAPPPAQPQRRPAQPQRPQAK